MLERLFFSSSLIFFPDGFGGCIPFEADLSGDIALSEFALGEILDPVDAIENEGIGGSLYPGVGAFRVAGHRRRLVRKKMVQITRQRGSI